MPSKTHKVFYGTHVSPLRYHNILTMKVIEHFLPHRPPFLMIKSIVGYIGGAAPILNAELPIQGSEPVFSGAVPPYYWPSIYIIEGLGQCCNLLSLLWTWERGCTSNALRAENVNAILTNTEEVDIDSTLEEQLLEIFGDRTMNTAIGMLASVDIEIVGQVRMGELLRYSVEQTHVLGGGARFAVQASVETQVVAHGTITGAQLEGIL